jgi:hypothetical protein
MKVDYHVLKLLQNISKSSAATMVATVEDDLLCFKEGNKFDEDDVLAQLQVVQDQNDKNLKQRKYPLEQITKILFWVIVGFGILTITMHSVALSYV